METNRLKIHLAACEEMKNFINIQENEILKTAYTEMLYSCIEHSDQSEWYGIWMIELKDGTHIGELCFKGLINGSAEIGYGIAGNFQEQGYATEAVSIAVSWALEQDEVNCVTAEVDADNIASVRVLEKCGFIPTGIFGEEGPIYKKQINV